MKKFNFLLFFFMYAMLSMAQKPYSIYDWSGKVKIKEYKEQQWAPVQKGKSVTGVDSVDIDKKGTLRIIDSRSNLIYKSAKTGKMRILTIINDAKKQNSRNIASVNKELLDGAMSKAQTPTKQVVGATTRGSGEDEISDSIISTFGWIANQAYVNKLPSNNSDIILKSHPTPEGIYFEIQNLSHTGLYVNVLYLNKQSKRINLCYIVDQTQEPEPYLYLPEGMSVQVKDVLFNYDASNDVYILVGTEDKYIPEQVLSDIQYLDIEAAQQSYTRCKYFKL